MARPKKDNPLQRVTISVDPADYKAMEALASSNELSTAWLIRHAMREFLDREAGQPVFKPAQSQKRQKGSGA